MGCDIHMYIQYKPKVHPYENWWTGFGGRINPGRNYTLFGILAGVRDNSVELSFKPKGLPPYLSYEIEDDLYIYISEDGEENTVTLERAQQWNRNIILDSNGKPNKVENPDWHNHTWLSIDELKRAYEFYVIESDDVVNVQYRTILEMMKSLENDGKNEVMVVFWFDN